MNEALETPERKMPDATPPSPPEQTPGATGASARTDAERCQAAWEWFFDEERLVEGTSGNVIDDMRQAFEAAWKARGESS